MVWGQPRQINDLICKLKQNSCKCMYILGNRKIGSEEAIELAQALGNNTSVEEFYISGHNIGLEGTKAFAKALEKNSSVRTICVGHSSFGDEGVQILCSGLEFNKSLKKLDLEGKSIGPQGGKTIGELMSKHKHIQELVISRNSVKDDGFVAICDGLTLNKETKLTILSATHCDINSSGIFKLIEFLLNPKCPLELLDLSYNPLANLSIEIKDAISRNTSLVTLRLTGCNLNDISLMNLSEALRHNNTLEELDISHNEITQQGAILLANCLNVNKSLITLNLGNNKIEDEGAKAFASIPGCCLMKLDISGNKLSSSPLCALLQSSTLSELRIFDNNIADGHTSDIALALELNKHIKCLDLGANSLNGADIAILSKVLYDHSSLATLELGGNDIQELGNKIIDDLQIKNPQLDIARDKRADDEEPVLN